MWKISIFCLALIFALIVADQPKRTRPEKYKPRQKPTAKGSVLVLRIADVSNADTSGNNNKKTTSKNNAETSGTNIKMRQSGENNAETFGNKNARTPGKNNWRSFGNKKKGQGLPPYEQGLSTGTFNKYDPQYLDYFGTARPAQEHYSTTGPSIRREASERRYDSAGISGNNNAGISGNNNVGTPVDNKYAATSGNKYAEKSASFNLNRPLHYKPRKSPTASGDVLMLTGPRGSNSIPQTNRQKQVEDTTEKRLRDDSGHSEEGPQLKREKKTPRSSISPSPNLVEWFSNLTNTNNTDFNEDA